MKRFSRRLGLVVWLILAALISPVLLLSAPVSASTLESRQVGLDALLVDVVTDRPQISAAEALPPGFHQVAISDLPSLREVGRPGLPYRTFLVGLPAGKTVQVTARSLGADFLGSFRLAPVVSLPAPGMEQDLAEPLTRADLIDAQDPLVFRAAGLYPEALAEVRGTGILRDQDIAEIRVHPVRYSPSDLEVVHHSRIQVRIRFVDAAGTDDAARRQPGEEGRSLSRPVRLDPAPEEGPEHLMVFDSILRGALVNYEMVARDRQRRRASLGTDAVPQGQEMASSGFPAMMVGAAGSVKVAVIQDGLYQVTPAMLTAAGVDVSMLNPQTFHMTSGGAGVPILVDGEGDGSFDSGDRVTFFGTGIKNDRFTRTNIYYLAFNGAAGPRMTSRSGAFTGTATTPQSFVTTTHAEMNLNYTARIRPGVTEAWYWGLQSRGSSSGTMNYPMTLQRIDPVAHAITVRARMLGLTNGNHTPRLLLNSAQIAEDTFNGQVNFTQTASPMSTSISNGANTLTVTMINNGNTTDQIATDFFEVDYRRTYAVDADQLLFDGEGTGKLHFSLSNLGSSDLVLVDATSPAGPLMISIPPSQIGVGPPFTASFEDVLPTDRAYAISTRAALRQPVSVVQEIPSSLASPANGADYIIITERSLLASMQPLAAHRSGQGLRTAIVATDDIYDEFNFGRVSPAAIKSFLSYAYANWVAPAPAYVLLAGDGHIDYTDNLGSGVPEVVPPILRAFSGFGESPSDNAYVSVAGADVFPEMFVGRLAIRSAADAGTIISNITNYETSPPIAVLNQQSLYVADNNDPIFQAILNNLQDFTPPTMAAAEAYLPGGDPTNPPTQSQVNATTDAIIAGFNTGSLLATYLGHGNVPLWASERILEHQPNPPIGQSARLDAARLTASGNQSFMVALNCINGYFADFAPAGPGHVDYSLAEEWTRHPGRGAIASWAPSALGQLSDYDSISWELYMHIFTDRMTTLGPATVAALLDAVNIFGVSTDNVESMHLFGDPATRLALDTDNDGLVDYREVAAGSNPLDGDTDDDGVADGPEVTQAGSSPTNPDSDGDLIYDGTEIGVTSPVAGTDPNMPFFVPDADPTTTTSPINADTDGGGVADGSEDANRNGRIDPGETNPNDPGDDVACPGPLPDVANLVVTRSGNDVVLTWDPAVSVPCATFRVYAATNAAFPKSSFAPFVAIGNPSSSTFTHIGAAGGVDNYDYLVRVVHPQLGEGPLGAYGQ